MHPAHVNWSSMKPVCCFILYCSGTPTHRLSEGNVATESSGPRPSIFPLDVVKSHSTTSCSRRASHLGKPPTSDPLPFLIAASPQRRLPASRKAPKPTGKRTKKSKLPPTGSDVGIYGMADGLDEFMALLRGGSDPNAMACDFRSPPEGDMNISLGTFAFESAGSDDVWGQEKTPAPPAGGSQGNIGL
ncbi:hypothetical protein OF83DRAFT_1083758 [Amylostereum chailletii]|nr:hypothetical protein OF83DRAFT_1083758 [Amylostereum chailletii]